MIKSFIAAAPNPSFFNLKVSSVVFLEVVNKFLIVSGSKVLYEVFAKSSYFLKLLLSL